MNRPVIIFINIWTLLSTMIGVAQKQDTTRDIPPAKDTVYADTIRQDTTHGINVEIDTIKSDSIQLEVAQQEKRRQDSLAREKNIRDSIRARTSYVPTGLRIGTDLVSLIRIPIPDGFFGWETSLDIDINRYFLVGEFGRWEKTTTSTDQHYHNEGYYFRVGVDIAFFSKRRDRNLFFLGMRYGRSTFDEEFNYTINNPSFGTLRENLKNHSITAYWFEVTAGFRMKLWKGLWMGYTIRIKPEPHVNHSAQFQSYDVPGFGQVSKVPNWGFNYQLFWRFGLPR